MSVVESDSEDRAPSPDSQCRICFGALRNKSIADSNCFHKFCFQCLIRWSEVKAECPLCKRPFKKILHSMKLSGEYQTYEVPERILANEVIIDSPPIITVAFGNRNRPSLHLRRNLEQLMQTTAMMAAQRILPTPPVYPQPIVRGVAFRQFIYHARRYVHLPRVLEYRRCDPAYYSSNSLHLARIEPWLRREMRVFVHATDEARTYTDEVLRLMTSFHIYSGVFRNRVEHIVGANFFRHFLHELSAFARSYYDMNGFDENADYEGENVYLLRTVPEAPINEVVVLDAPAPSVIVLSDSQSDSEVEVIAPPCPEVVISSDDDSRALGRVSGRSRRVVVPRTSENNVQSNPSTSTSLAHETERDQRSRNRDRRSPRHDYRESSSSSVASVSHRIGKKRKLKNKHKKQPHLPSRQNKLKKDSFSVHRSKDRSDSESEHRQTRAISKKKHRTKSVATEGYDYEDQHSDSSGPHVRVRNVKSRRKKSSVLLSDSSE